MSDLSSEILFEIRLLTGCFLTGVWLLVVYDVLRVLRLIIPHHSFWTGLEDLGYWIYAGTTTFVLLYRLNDGNLRAYAIIGVFAGMVLYNETVSSIFRKLLKKLCKCFTIKKERKKVGDADERPAEKKKKQG